MTDLNEFEKRRIVARTTAAADAPAADAVDRRIAGSASAISAEPMAERVSAQLQPGRVTGRLMVLLAAALLLAALTVTAVAVGSGLLDSSLPTRIVLESTLTAEPSPTSSETTGLYRDWTRGSVDDTGPDPFFMSGVALFGDTLVAVGANPTRVWTSTDGAQWTAVADQPAFARGGVEQIAADQDRVVGVGVADNGLTGAVWVSADAVTWERIDGLPLFRTVAALPDGGFVAATLDPAPDSEIWASADGISWARVASKEALNDGSVSRLRVIAHDGGGTGAGPAVVAVGRRDSTHGAIWIASVDDLTSWEPAQIAADLVLLNDVAGLDGLDIAVGAEPCCIFRAYRSPDGRDWHAVAGSLDGEPGTWVQSLLATPSGLVALGSVDTSWESEGDFAAWSSSDSATWDPIEGAFELTADFAFGDALVLRDGALVIVGSQVWVVR